MKTSLDNTLSRWWRLVMHAFLLLLPWQTIFLTREVFVEGQKWEYATLGFYASEFVLWVAVFLFMAQYVRRLRAVFTSKTFRFSWTKDRFLLGGALFFIVFMWSGVFRAIDPAIVTQKTLYVIEVALFTLMLYLGGLEKRALLRTLAIASLLPAVLGIWQFLSQSTVASTLFGLSAHDPSIPGTSIIASETLGRYLRAYGPFSHPNVFGGFAFLMIVVGFLFFHIAKTAKDRLLGLFTLLLNSAALFFSFSRSAWLAFFLWVLFYSIFALRKKVVGAARVVATTIAIWVVLVAVFFQPAMVRFTGQSYAEQRSVQERIALQDHAADIFSDHALLGVGIGNYTHALRANLPDLPVWQAQPVHNVFVLLAVELGVVGIALLAAAFLLGFFNWRAVKNLAISGIPLLPLLFFDHYILTQYIGLYIVVLFFFVHASMCMQSDASKKRGS